MICINHFCPSVVTNSKALKKGAVPTIFDTEQCIDTNDTPEAISPMSPLQGDHQDKSNETSELHKECSIQKINDHVQILRLEKQIMDLKKTVKIQSNHIMKLNKDAAKKEKVNNSLENMLEELKQQNLISKRTMDALEVI